MTTRKPRSALQNLVLAVAAALSLLGGYYLGNMASGKKPELQAATVIPEPREIADFSLVDSNNEVFNLDSLKGKWSLIFFGYTHCPDICPTALSSMVNVYKSLDDDTRGKLQIVFVSVDPKRDTPEHLKKYVEFFHPDFLAATGEDLELKQLTKQLALQYKIHTPDEKGDYLVDHSAWLIIVNPDARFHGVISGSQYPNTEAIAQDITAIADYY